MLANQLAMPILNLIDLNKQHIHITMRRLLLISIACLSLAAASTADDNRNRGDFDYFYLVQQVGRQYLKCDGI
jgi:hypothetical protein